MTVSRSATRAAFLLLLIYPACSGDPTGSAPACDIDCPIVFAERINFIWDLYTINADGSNRQPLTDDTATDVYPAWSPDHRQIAFWSGRDPQGVYLMNADGSGRHRINAFEPGHMSWSPDGRRIAMDGSDGSGYDIFVMRSDGSGFKNITNSYESEGKPAWSPAGNKIAYNRAGQIWVMNTDGSGAYSLTGWQGQGAFDPSWSPDGTHIVFASIDPAGITNLYVMTTDGKNWRRLTTTNRAADRIPDWSPDGSKVVFQRDFSDSVGVYVVSVAGNTPLRLAGGISGHPSW